MVMIIGGQWSGTLNMIFLRLARRMNLSLTNNEKEHISKNKEGIKKKKF
jgi:hypothetical protein